MSTLLDTLRRFPALTPLSDSALERLAQSLQKMSIERGQYIFEEGDPGDAVFFLAEGVLIAERSVALAAGEHKELAVLPANSLVGELALADAAPRSASARAEISSCAYRLGRAEFTAFAIEQPIAARQLFEYLFAETSRRLRSTSDELVALYEVARFVASAGQPRHIAEEIVGSVLARLGSRYGLIALYEAATNSLRVVFAVGGKITNLCGTLIPLSSGITARAFDEGRSILIEQLLGSCDPWESGSMMIAPLTYSDRRRGVLLVGEMESGLPYQSSQLLLLTAVANISARTLVEAFS